MVALGGLSRVELQEQAIRWFSSHQLLQTQLHEGEGYKNATVARPEHDDSSHPG